MKTYLEACKIPLVQIGAAQVPRLILGIHPYDGISYVSPEKDAENRGRFLDVERVAEVFRCASVEFGVTVAQTDHMIPDLNRLHLVALWKAMETSGVQIATVPFIIVPLKRHGAPLDGERVYATYDRHSLDLGGTAYREHFMNDPIIQYNLAIGAEEIVTCDTAEPYSQEEMRDVEVDYAELEQYIGFFAGSEILMADPGCEADLLAMTGRFDLLREYVAYLRARFDTVVSSVHHPGVTIPLLEQEEIAFDGYITPVNKPGVFMLPTPELSLRAIRACSKPVIAIKPQAGGRFLGEEAFDYVLNEVGAASCMIGLGTIDEMRETLTAATKVLGVK